MSHLPSEIHVWEFPKSFRIQINPTLIKAIVDCAIETIGDIYELATLLNVHKNTVYEYRAGKHFIPLEYLIQICELAGNDYSIERLESYITGYKSGMRTRPVKNPILPIQETPELFALIGHLTGDGGYSGMAYYHNTNRILIDKFKDLLHKAFGDVPFKISVDKYERKIKARKKVISVYFPMTIVRLLRHHYNIDFRTFTGRVPTRLHDLPQNYAAAYLRAFGDDEGRVQDSDIELYSANRELIIDITNLVNAKFPVISKFMSFNEKKDSQGRIIIYSLRFTTKAFTSYQELIGFNHPEKKYNLESILARRDRGWRSRTQGETRRLLLSCLKSGAMTTKELARFLNVSSEAIRYHLDFLKTLRAIIQIGIWGSSKAYSITKIGQKLLELPPIGIEMLEFNKRAQIKLKILKKLAKEDGMTFKDFENHLGLGYYVIWRLFNTKKQQGRKSKILGLLDLGLVSRYRTDQNAPYTYRLTDKGYNVLNMATDLFPDL